MELKVIFVVFGIFVFANGREITPTKSPECLQYCSVVKCARPACTENETLEDVKGCGCCFTCVPKPTLPELCPKDACSKVLCPMIRCMSGYKLGKGGYCNCCDRCIKILKEGEYCGGRSRADGVCDHGLLCVNSYCRKICDS